MVLFVLYRVGLFRGVEEVICKVYQVKLFSCTGYGGVEPAEVVRGELIRVKGTLLYKDAVPVAALGFMTGESVGKFNLQGVVVFVLFYVVLYDGLVSGVLTVMGV